MTITEYKKTYPCTQPATMNSVRAMFELYLKPGESVQSIAAKIREIGLTTRHGRPLSDSHVHKVLLNPYYIGINRFDGQDYPGAQTPIVRREVWEAVQDKRQDLLLAHNRFFQKRSCGTAMYLSDLLR